MQNRTLFSCGRALIAALLAALTLFFAVPSLVQARPRSGGFGRGGSIGRSSSPSRSSYIPPSAPSRSSYIPPSAPSVLTRSGGFGSGGSIGNNTPAVVPSRPVYTLPVINTPSRSIVNSRPAYTLPNRPYVNASRTTIVSHPYVSPRSTTIIYHNSRPAYGGNVYVYDNRPYYAPGYLYSPPIYSPQGAIVQQGGFNWGGFFLTLLIIGIIIAVIVGISRSQSGTKTKTTYY